MNGADSKPRLRINKPCQNMLWQGLFSLQNDFLAPSYRLREFLLFFCRVKALVYNVKIYFDKLCVIVDNSQKY